MRGKELKVLLYGALSAGSRGLWLKPKLMPGSLADPSNSNILIWTEWCFWTLFGLKHLGYLRDIYYLSFKRNFGPSF